MTDTRVCKCVLFSSLCALLDMLMRNGNCLLRLSDIPPTQYETIPGILLISRPVESSLLKAKLFTPFARCKRFDIAVPPLIGGGRWKRSSTDLSLRVRFSKCSDIKN